MAQTACNAENLETCNVKNAADVEICNRSPVFRIQNYGECTTRAKF